MIEDRCNMNIGQYAVHLTSRKVRIAGDMTIYEYKNILQRQ